MLFKRLSFCQVEIPTTCTRHGLTSTKVKKMLCQFLLLMHLLGAQPDSGCLSDLHNYVTTHGFPYQVRCDLVFSGTKRHVVNALRLVLEFGTD